jgi:hypothetical protein
VRIARLKERRERLRDGRRREAEQVTTVQSASPQPASGKDSGEGIGRS